MLPYHYALIPLDLAYQCNGKLFLGLILYVPVNNFSVMLEGFCLFCLIRFFTSTQQSFSYAGRFFLGLTSTKLG